MTNMIEFSPFSRSKIEKTNYRQKEKQVLDSILGKGYDKRIRPSGKNDTGKIVTRQFADKIVIVNTMLVSSSSKVSSILLEQTERQRYFRSTCEQILLKGNE
jgi:hypothetical protein